MEIFCIRLKELREEKGLTRRKLAELLNVSESTVGKWELNKREPYFQTLTELAKLFDVTTDYLLGLE